MSLNGDISRKPSQMSNRGVDVGFANFPHQVFRRCIKNGFEFNLMVVGQSGLGKSTFLNSLFLAEVHDQKAEPSKAIPSTVKIESKTMKIVENDVRVTITFIDTPGFGDLVDNSNCWDSIVQYIEGNFSKYLNEETKIERSPVIEDQRVHLCLYFIAPTGHSLKALDLECMRALQDRVNIIPVIAKADTLTAEEMSQFKQNILNDIKKHEIRLYKFPDEEHTDLEIKGKTATRDYRTRIPFAVIGSNLLKEVDKNRRARVREYPWGIVEVENLAHNDFIALRDMIIRNNLIDLIEVTKIVHYENFRVRKLTNNKMGNLSDTSDPFTSLEQERKNLEKEVEEARSTKERIFREKVAARERNLDERALAMDEQEKENENLLNEKRAELDKIMEEVAELRKANGINMSDSGSTISRYSPNEKKKKTGTIHGIFHRSNN
ncbi:septin domain-containing protein [Ditylenchus destructor]|uniref:Septin n=1 Tax=Ditylenchus destructor TaxID=166010 RepID=A0AAD4MR43_9BILA|nr:septin domain-containing protein [Ditylenchus destructor]